jgi:hypothetical protein
VGLFPELLHTPPGRYEDVLAGRMHHNYLTCSDADRAAFDAWPV